MRSRSWFVPGRAPGPPPLRDPPVLAQCLPKEGAFALMMVSGLFSRRPLPAPPACPRVLVPLSPPPAGVAAGAGGGGAGSPSDLCSEAPAAPPTPRLAGSSVRCDLGKRTLGWTRGPDTHLPRQPSACGRGRRGSGLSPLPPCPPRWATGRNLGVPRVGAGEAGGLERQSLTPGKRGARGRKGRGHAGMGPGPGSSRGCLEDQRLPEVQGMSGA